MVSTQRREAQILICPKNRSVVLILTVRDVLQDLEPRFIAVLVLPE